MATARRKHQPRRPPRLRRLAGTWFGVGLLLIYLGWNAWFLSLGCIPPSMLTGITGLPCPTTGGTRSFMALIHGDLTRSLYFNPMTLPIIGLLAVTLVFVRRRRGTPPWLLRAWVGVLLAAWVLKFLSPAATW